MGRKMVQMKRIANEKTRITTYKKRKRCLFKKAWEFSTLCGVETCLILYGPNKAGDEVITEAEIWPEISKVHNIISKYRDTASSSCRKTFHMNDFVKIEKNNVDTQIQKPIRSVKYPNWDEKLEKCSQEELLMILGEVDKKILEASNRVNFLAMKKQISTLTTVPETSRSANLQSFVCSYNNDVVECKLPYAAEQQLVPLPPSLRNLSLPYLHSHHDPMNSSLMETTTINSNLAETAEAMMMLRGNNHGFNPFSGVYGGVEAQYGSIMQRQTYFEPYWMHRNNVNQFTNYYTLDPLTTQMLTTQPNEWEGSSKEHLR